LSFKKFLFLLLALSILSCRSEPEENALIVALDSEPAKINPLFLTDLNSHMISNLLFRGLIKIDEQGNPQPELAQSWEIRNNGMEIIFYLRKNIYWHDGMKFSSIDVIFTYNLLNSQNVASPRKGLFGPIKEIKALDSDTLVIRYSEPYGSIFEAFTFGILPEHIGLKVLEPNFDTKPIGTGPYKIREWKKGEYILLEHFEKYHQTPPKIKKIILKFIPDQTTKYLELKSGKIHVAELPTYFKADELLGRYKKYKAESFRYVCLGFDLNKKPFNEETFRKAIAHSINKEELINVATFGEGSISTGPYPKGVWYFNQDVKPFQYNPEIAKKILKEMGLQNLKFGLYINNENKEAIKASQYIKENLKNLGIDLEIRLFDWQTFRHRIIEEKNFDAVILSRAYLWDPDIYDLWHSSKTEKGQWNFFSFKDKDLDRLLELGRKTVNFKERKIIYQKVHRLLYEKQACVFLYETPLIFYADKKIKGIKPSPLGLLYDIEKWEKE